jgi:transcriptional regulator with GAF, ATPase, and Fis domain
MPVNDLLCRIATRFVTASAEDADDLIAASLREFALAARLDWATLWLPGPGSSGTPRRPSEPHGAEWFGPAEGVPDGALRDLLRQKQLHSVAVVPVVVSPGSAASAPLLAFASRRLDEHWPFETKQQLRLLAALIGQARLRANERRLASPAPGGAAEAARPVSSASGRPVQPPALGRITSNSPAVLRALEHAALVAPTPSTVLLLGETGVGKGVFAREIHESSGRQQRPMVCVNCAAIPGPLLESELFGRERGAFTGATTRQIGRFEAAHRSTIFLDEIGELSAEAQVKLLRVLEERVIERLGSSVPVPVDVRVIAATNLDLAKAVADGKFREDLFYRLDVFPIRIPPLRERVEDIPVLVRRFVDEIASELGKSILSVSDVSMKALQQYAWRGNVRELRNVIARAVIGASGPHLTVALPPPRMPDRHASSAATLDQLVADHIRATLETTRWRVRGPGGAAERLGIKPTTLETRMAKLGIRRGHTIGYAGRPVRLVPTHACQA